MKAAWILAGFLPILPLFAPPALAQMADYTGAAAGAAGLGTGLGAGASKMLTEPLTRASTLTAAQQKQAQLAIDQFIQAAKAKTGAGAHTAAGALFMRAAQERQRWFGPGDPEVGRLYVKAAKEDTLGKDFAGAEASYKAALVACSKTNGPGSPYAIPILSGLGSALTSQNRFGEAVTNFKQALTLQDRNEPADSPTSTKLRMSIIDVCMKSADYASADPMLKQCIETMESKGVPDKPMYLNLLSMQEKELRETCKVDDADKVAAKISALAGPPQTPPTPSGSSSPSTSSTSSAAPSSSAVPAPSTGSEAAAAAPQATTPSTK